jgi:hypothetical protein
MSGWNATLRTQCKNKQTVSKEMFAVTENSCRRLITLPEQPPNEQEDNNSTKASAAKFVSAVTGDKTSE